MDKFLEQLENLKATFAQLPEDCLIEAIERMDQTVEQLSRSVVFVEAQEDVLADMGKDIVQDFFNSPDNPFSSPGPSTSSADVGDFYPATSSDDFDTSVTSSNDFFPIEFHHNPNSFHESTSSASIFCFTCGEGFNNRKGLYRHGNATRHQTREQKYNKKNEGGVHQDPEQLVPQELNPFPLDFLEPDPQQPEESPIIQDPSDISLENTEKSEITDDKVDGKLICYECNLGFKNRKALWRHGQRSSHRVRLKRALVFKGGHIQCSECIYSSSTVASMKQHYKRNHKKCM